MAGLLHRTAQPPTLAAFRPWEGSAGAGRVRPAAAKIMKFDVEGSRLLLMNGIHFGKADQFIGTGAEMAVIDQDHISIFCSTKIAFVFSNKDSDPPGQACHSQLCMNNYNILA